LCPPARAESAVSAARGETPPVRPRIREHAAIPAGAHRKGNDMSVRNIVFAAAAVTAMATPALAQDTSPWDLRERNAYVLDMQNKMWSTGKISPKGWAMMTKRARAVPRGTVFFMERGRLMMASSGMFDRAGSFMAMGGY
jgi:hypothetical protein